MLCITLAPAAICGLLYHVSPLVHTLFIHAFGVGMLTSYRCGTVPISPDSKTLFTSFPPKPVSCKMTKML